MRLSQVLKLHANHAASTQIPLCLGDGYLCQKSSLYLKIRSKTIQLGFKYSSLPSVSYQAFPMGELESLMTHKTIPYVDNSTALVSINDKCNGQLDWNHVVDNLKANYHFHESCHAVARSLKPENMTQTKDQVMAMIIEESFANTCEFLLIADAQDLIHRLFLEKISYFTVFEDRTTLKKMIEKYSLACLFELMIYGYILSHFFQENINEQDFKRLLETCRFPKECDVKILKSLIKNAFSLNPRFRETTTEMYFKLNGLSGRTTDILNFDPLQHIQSSPELKNMIRQLTQFIGDTHE